MPYKLRPVPPQVALLHEDGSVIAETGELLDLDALPAGFRVWGSYDTVRALMLDGRGEALCWNGEEIRWRHRPRPEETDSWKRRASDVHVVRLPFHQEPEPNLRALTGWRDWLESYGAAPTGTTGSAAWSLLRARLTGPLWLGMGAAPPLRQTLGGRQELGPAGQGSYAGRLRLLDMPAAYARELGHLYYGGHWTHTKTLPRPCCNWPASVWARDRGPVFCRAQVRVPGLQYGPLPRRPRRTVGGLRGFLQGATYPTSTRLQGVWTWQELEAAERHGCQVKVLDTWAHMHGGLQPFLPWWRAIEQGRTMPGLAGALAKITGNALWGRFCMDASVQGERTITTRQGRKMLRRRLTIRGGFPPAHDLAETVSGRVRAELYDLMAGAGDRLLSAHTDGAWCEADGADVPQGWRVKERAVRLDLLDPQVLRYWTRENRSWVVFSGVPSRYADEAFSQAWTERMAS